MNSPEKMIRPTFQKECKYFDDLCSFSNRVRIAILLTILCLLTIARIAIIEYPRLDRTDWKEIDIITISSNYWKHGYSFLSPEISWPAEPPRVTAMELPLVPYVASLFYPLLGFNAFSVRWLTLLASLIFTLYIYRITGREYGFAVGIYAALISAVFLLYHLFGRLLYSDPWMMAMEVLAIFHFLRYVEEKNKKDLILTVLGFSLAISLKITPFYLLIPLCWIAYRQSRSIWYSLRLVGFITVMSMLLPVLWYPYAYYLTKHSIDVFGVFGGHDKFQTVASLSNPAWYREMFMSIGWAILGGKAGLLLLSVGFVVSIHRKAGGIFYSYLVAILCFFVIVAEGNFDAPYRQLTIVPAFSGIIGIGIAGITMFLTRKVKGREIEPKKVARLLFIIGIFLALCPAIYQYKRFSLEVLDSPVHISKWRLAKVIDQLKKPDTKLVVVGEYGIKKGGNTLSPILYYYSGLQGWTLQRGDWDINKIEECMRKGATFFVGTDIGLEPGLREFVDSLKIRFPVCYEDEKNTILSLVGSCASS